MDLITQLNEKLNDLTQLTKMLATYGERLARAEYDYKIELAKEVINLKDKGTPATLINLIIYGQPEIARLRLKRDLAEVLYNSNQEAINSTKLYIKVIENQIQREY